MLDIQNKLSFPNLLNVRDLGGYATCDGQQTRWKSIVRADDLVQLTSEGVTALVEYGIRTVIDLRWPLETESQPGPFQKGRNDVRYMHIPLLGVSEEIWHSRSPKTTKELWNGVALDYAQNGIRDVMRAIANASEGGVLFHCLAGKDRTGIVAALLLALADVQPNVIAWDYSVTTENLREAYLAANPGAPEAVLERVRCPPEAMHNMLNHLNQRYDGISNYLHEIGLHENETQTIRARLRLSSEI